MIDLLERFDKVTRTETGILMGKLNFPETFLEIKNHIGEFATSSKIHIIFHIIFV
jgi:hypothetical protein